MTINTKEDLKTFLKDVPEDAIVYINGGCAKISWSPKSDIKEYQDRSDGHGETAVITENVLDD
jgi:hypothetical protein